MTLQIGYLKDEGSNFESVVILDDASGDTFEIQRAVKFDEQDAKLGMATYCLVRNGLTHYGGVDSWGLTKRTLSVALNHEAATALQLPREIEFTIPDYGSKVVMDHFQELIQMSPLP